MPLAQRVREKRKAARLNQSEIASLIGVSLKTITRWESGERSPDAEVLLKLAAALKTSVAYLVGEKNDEDAKMPVKESRPEEAVKPASESPTVYKLSRNDINVEVIIQPGKTQEEIQTALAAAVRAISGETSPARARDQSLKPASGGDVAES